MMRSNCPADMRRAVSKTLAPRLIMKNAKGEYMVMHKSGQLVWRLYGTPREAAKYAALLNLKVISPSDYYVLTRRKIGA